MAAKSDETTALLAPSPRDLTVHEWLRDELQRFRLTSCYVCYCIAMSLCCLVLLGLTVVDFRDGKQDGSPRMRMCDQILTIAIVSETLMNMVVLGCRRFWMSAWFIFDGLVCAVCLWCVLQDVWSKPTEEAESISRGGMVLRYVAQASRVVWLLRNAQAAKTQQQAVEETEVVLPEQPASSAGC
eukprot:TRINITY_DN34522_c0_g1_i1.p1 TRINITY_DN34522_c0_g1~~TRINITY_DN34522_c0_g1_i1.p1  ORF type:complete len:184 (-),score=44.62 TRINITY_DN34522_c0_g1_i1:34-585(-)